MTSVVYSQVLAAELAGLESAPETPFVLKTALGELYCTQVLRFLPGRRLVLSGSYKEHQVIIKCFFGAQAVRDQKRELNGIAGFEKAKVLTPQLIAEHATAQLSMVLTRCLEPVQSFDTIWQGSLTDQQRRQWLERISFIIGKLHLAGVCQQDIHLDNLLVQNDDIYLIDGGGASTQTGPLSRADALKNLALFQAVLYPTYDRFIEDVWAAYSASACSLNDGVSEAVFSREVQKQRKWRERYIQKSLRNCTQFRVEKNWSRFMALDREVETPALREFLANPEPAIESGKVIKRGRTNTVAVVTLSDGQQVFVKRYKSRKGILHKYLRCLMPSRARISWLNGHLLTLLGISTPRPLAMLEKRFGPATRCSYIVNSYQPAPHALEWFSRSPLPSNHQQVAEKIGGMLYNLQRSLVFHGDLKATNILLVNDEPVLIDLDAMTSFKDPDKFARANRVDLERFARNWSDNPEVERLFGVVIASLPRL